MPLIPPTINTLPPLGTIGGIGTLTAIATVQQRFQSTISAGGQLTAAAKVNYAGVAAISGAGDVSAIGRLNNEANVLAAATISGTGALSATGKLNLFGQALLQGKVSLQIDSTLIPAERWETLVVFRTIPAFNTDKVYNQSARFKINGVEKPIKRFNLSAPSNAVGKTLQVELAKPLKTNLSVGASFQFEIFDGTVWQIVLSGQIGQGGYSASFEGRSLTLTSSSDTDDKLSRPAPDTVILYDPARTAEPEIAGDSLLRDEFGNVYLPDVVAISALSFRRLLQYAAVNIAGFAGIDTNIADFPIQQFSFEIGQSAIQQALSVIGFIEPLSIYVENNRLKVLDMTAVGAVSSAASVPVTASDYLTIQIQTGGEAGAIDGAIVSYSEAGGGDYYLQRFDTAEEITQGAAGAVKISTVNEYRDHYTVADPIRPVRSVLNSIEKTSERLDTGQLVGREKTIYNYDSEGVLVSSEKTVETLAPVPETQTFILKEVERENQRLKYTSLSTGERYLTGRITETRGLVVVDEANTFVGRPFKQPVTVSVEGGNFDWPMGVREEPIKATFEKFDRTRGGLTTVTTTVYDYLSNQVSRSVNVTDAGETDIRGRRRASKMIVYRAGFNPSATQITNRLINLSIGEMPLDKALPMVRRIIARKFAGKGTAVATLSGARLNLERGLALEFKDVDSESFGVFLINGYQIEGSIDGRLFRIEHRLDLIQL